MKLHAPAASRNQEPIAVVLRTLLPSSGRVLETSSGSGEHAVAFAARFPSIEFVPSDIDKRAISSINAYRDAYCSAPRDGGPLNVAPPLELDVESEAWPLKDLDGVISINMIHIAPWSACVGLLAGASQVLKPGGFVFLYGPFFQEDVDPAASNVAFDRSLRGRDSRFGIRDLEAVSLEAKKYGLVRTEIIAMPANNLSVVFRLKADSMGTR